MPPRFFARCLACACTYVPLCHHDFSHGAPPVPALWFHCATTVFRTLAALKLAGSGACWPWSLLALPWSMRAMGPAGPGACGPWCLRAPRLAGPSACGLQGLRSLGLAGLGACGPWGLRALGPASLGACGHQGSLASWHAGPGAGVIKFGGAADSRGTNNWCLRKAQYLVFVNRCKTVLRWSHAWWTRCLGIKLSRYSGAQEAQVLASVAHR